MNERDRELEAFSKFIGALEPWLGEVVLIGGWAHRLYRHHPLARRLAYLPLITLDGDVAVPPKLKGRKLSVRKRLLDAGFVEEFVGEDWPPATHYHYGKGGGFYAEFLSPLVGSEYDRRGKRKAGSRRYFVSVASLHRDPDDFSVEGAIGQRERSILAEAESTDREPHQFSRSKNP